MSKYNRKTIFDYINGNDITEYNIETLEDDYEFMIDVINYTNDKNIYNLCSDKVKKNYVFVKFIINKFKDDLDFICQVADEYLEFVENDIERIELAIIMSEITKNNREYCINYKVLSEATYSANRVEIELIKVQQKDDLEFINEIQMGFLFIVDTYSSSNIIMNYYAEKFINDILTEYEIDFEALLHQRFNNFEEIEKYGINNYLINFISLYDSYLSAYVSCHLEVLNNLKKLMNTFKNRWNHYELLQERERYDTLIDSVHRYMEEHEFECSFGETEILYYIGIELGISEKILEYDNIDIDLEDIKSNFTIDKNNMNLADLRHYQSIKKIMLEIINPDGSKSNQEEHNANRNKISHKSRILKISFLNTNKK